MHLHELFDLFRQLKNVNNAKQSYLDLLPLSCISKTAEMLKAGLHDYIPETG